MSISQIRPARGLEHLTFADFPSRRPIKGIIPTASAAALLGGTLYFYSAQEIGIGDQLAWLIVFLAACIASIAGFAFSALAGSLLFHVTHDSIEAIQIMLVASIAIQTYSVWRLRRSIVLSALGPYFAGGLSTVMPGVYLLLNTPPHIYLVALGGFLVAYGSYMLVRRPYQLKNNSLIGQFTIGALGGITGATAAFPGAFITIWCGAHGWDKEQQRAIYQPYILGMQLIALLVLGAVKPLETVRLDLLQYILPAALGAWIGLHIFGKLSTGQFNKLVSAFLLLSGLMLSARAL
jgi:uncharacterized membrane protein YfcA